MPHPSVFLLAVSALSYAVAFFYHLGPFLGVREKGHETAALFLRLGFFLGTLYFAVEGIKYRSFLPVLGLSQALAFFAWSLAFVYLVLLARAQSESFGLVLNPILFLLVSVAALTFPGSKPSSAILNRPDLMSSSFALHITTAFFAYASFTLSFAAGILYLIQHRQLKAKHAGRFYHKLPSLEELERLIYQPLYWGAPLLILALGVGFFWSKSVNGNYWIWDPKTLVTAVIAVLYMGILGFRSLSLLRGKRMAWLSMMAFLLVLASFVGLRFIEGSHNYLQ